jgi:soluble lytic murein transglycosylase-like protein
MKYESSFKKNAKSKSGAKGLLQITKIAEKEVTAYYDHIPDDIIVENEMHRHIIYAISYLNILLSKYKDIPIALESYRVGPSKMDSILDNNKDFKVKSTYVTNILSTYANIKMICLSSE